MADGASTAILRTAPGRRHLDIAKSMVWVRAAHGKGVLRQFREIAALTLSRQRLEPKDYFLYALFRDGLAPAERRAYLSVRSGAALNLRLAPLGGATQHGLLNDKVLAGLLLGSAGFAVAPILGLVSRDMRVPALRRMRGPAELTDFFADPGVMPCFGKPAKGSLGMGAVSILAASEGGRRLHLGDGREVAAADLAAEIMAHYPEGYLFQPFLRQHPEVEALNGPTVGMLRVVTLRGAEGPAPLYTVLKMPPPGAMTDGVATARPNAMALVDMTSGAITRAQDMARLCIEPLTESLTTGRPLVGAVLPDVAAAVEMAVEAHRLFPGHGLLGFDIALTDRGPLLNEINGSPFHLPYQRAADRGLLNPEFQPRIEEALAVTRAQRAAGDRRRWWQKALRLGR